MLIITGLAASTLAYVPTPANAVAPSFSPDGTHLAFVASAQSPTQAAYSVYTCDIRGRALRQLTNTQQMNMSPSWSEGFRSFGVVNLGGQVEQEWYVDNPGSDTLRVTQVRFSDTQFAAEPQQFAVALGETQKMRLRFAPTRVGTHYTTLTFLSNDPDDPEIRLVLNGRGRPTSWDQSQPLAGEGGSASAHSGN